MTPISTTKDRLILRERPWMLGLALIAAIAILTGIAISEARSSGQEAANGPLLLVLLLAVVFAVFVRQDEAHFDRAAGTILIRRRTVFGGTSSRHALGDLRRATVETHPDDVASSRKATRRPVLEFHSGPKVPLTPVYSAGSGAKQAVEAINAWLRVKG